MRVASYLLATESLVLTTADVCRECLVGTDALTGILGTKLVRAAMQLRNWRKTTKKRLGLPGEHSRALIRPPD